MQLNTTFAVQQTMQLLAIPSPTGFTMHVTQYLLDTLTNMGFQPVRNRKGSVCCTLGGEGRHHPRGKAVLGRGAAAQRFHPCQS